MDEYSTFTCVIWTNNVKYRAFTGCMSLEGNNKVTIGNDMYDIYNIEERSDDTMICVIKIECYTLLSDT